MTDLLTRDPNDTGDIPTGVGEKTVRIVGERTENLAPYAAGLRPTLRRGDTDLTREIPVYEPAGFTYLDTAAGFRPAAVLGLITDFTPPGLPKPPPLPPEPQPTPPADELWEAEPVVKYAGRHRRPSRWDWLTVPLSAAVQRIKAAAL